MNIREKVYKGVGNMNPEELSVLYEQIRLMMKIKQKSKGERPFRYSIERIQEMTLSSKSNWAETIISEREERL